MSIRSVIVFFSIALCSSGIINCLSLDTSSLVSPMTEVLKLEANINHTYVEMQSAAESLRSLEERRDVLEGQLNELADLVQREVKRMEKLENDLIVQMNARHGSASDIQKQLFDALKAEDAAKALFNEQSYKQYYDRLDHYCSRSTST
ncbi:uncharacterized protein LOC106648886 [Trichogramma pretiosum]|uniref:uncharacterized protein LOC106648886 n=1 Tax=Trichogramma pretiosum TaxID=7493 RepID=UPI0006C9BCEB|nr:uncharacterized protein LOC106648886 [Trichogramma pretiosum]XP_023313509.1 uncharacterized protein LOC106648886 [Trichogramma pretiosum]